MARMNIGNAVAVGDVDGLTELGKLVTYSMTDEPKNGPTLVRSWAKHGLDVNDLPDQRSGLHIFQSACRSVETRRKGGTGVEIKVDEVVNDAAECVYQITRMVRDKGEKVIEHPKAMTIAFDKKFDTISVRQLEDYNVLRGLEEQIREHYAKHGKAIPGQKIRNSVRSTLLNIGAQNVRRKAGGLYFVPKQYRVMKVSGQGMELIDTMPVLVGLKGVIEELYGERGDFYTIPLIDDESSQKMVSKHFSINVNTALRETMERAVQRVRQGKGERGVRQELITSLYGERRRLAAAVNQFQQIVTLEGDDIAANLRDLDTALDELQRLADEE